MKGSLSSVVELSHNNHFFAVRASPESMLFIFLQFFGCVGLSRVYGVRIYPKIGIFTAPCGTHETSIFKLSIKSCLSSSI